MSDPIRLVLDTNVLVSAIFYAGTPFAILDAWRHKRVAFVVTREILEEYRETGARLGRRFPAIALDPWLELIEQYAVLVDAAALPQQVCTDPDDDMFLACAIAAGATVICSGDKALLALSGYRGIAIMRPREFVTGYL